MIQNHAARMGRSESKKKANTFHNIMGHWFIHPNEDEEVLLKRYKTARFIVRPMGENTLKLLYFVFCIVLERGQYDYSDPALGLLLNYLQQSVDKHYENEDPDEEETPVPKESFIDRIVLPPDDADDQRLLELPVWYEEFWEEVVGKALAEESEEDEEEEEEEEEDEEEESEEDEVR